VAALVSLGVGVAACSSTTSSSSTTTTSGSGNSKNFTITTDNGQASLSLDGKLPPNWPANVPVPSGATPAGSGSLVGQSNGVMVGVYESTETPENVYTFYTTDRSIKTSSEKKVGSGSKFVGRVKLTAPVTAGVTILPHNGVTLIVMVITGGS
jgi:hypothetical protein